MAPFAYAEKQAEILFRLIFFREKHYFDWKNKLKSTDYKLAEQSRWIVAGLYNFLVLSFFSFEVIKCSKNHTKFKQYINDNYKI
jgi:hypothetical protein